MIRRGSIRPGQQVALRYGGEDRGLAKIAQVLTFTGLARAPVEEASAGDIVAITGIEAVMPPVGTMIPSEANIRISIPVLLFTIGISTLSGLLFGAAPAWQATRFDLNEVLELGGRSGGSGAGPAGRRHVLRQ